MENSAGSGLFGGSVAYDAKNKRYVTTGKYLRAYWNQQDIGAGDTAPALFVDENFMSAVSSNGTSWTAQFDNSECSGFPPTASAGTGGDRNAKPSVTFGNGKFIASSSFKLNYPLYSAPSFAPYVLTAYAAADRQFRRLWQRRQVFQGQEKRQRRAGVFRGDRCGIWWRGWRRRQGLAV